MGRAGAGRGARLRGRDGRDGRDGDARSATPTSTGAKSSGNLGAITGNRDPYLAYMKDYVWGSNSTKSDVGNLFAAVVSHQLDAASNADMTRAASRYVHYIHGTNPLSLVYLTNMYAHGAENCANEMFHTWFADGSAMWDRAGMSTYGPPPGYLTGGPNPSYDWDGCCPSELRRRRQQRDLHVAVDLAAEGAARAEVVQGLQHRLAARFVERHRAERRLPGGLHPPAVEVRR